MSIGFSVNHMGMGMGMCTRVPRVPVCIHATAHVGGGGCSTGQNLAPLYRAFCTYTYTLDAGGATTSIEEATLLTLVSSNSDCHELWSSPEMTG